MGQNVINGKGDADKTRDELITELSAAHNQISRLKDIVRRYERVAGKRDAYRSLYDLEAKKDSVEALREELRRKQNEVDLHGEELEVVDEVLRVQLEELNAKDDKLTKAIEALLESESLFRQLSESLPQLVWTCRADGPCDYLSPQWVTYTGVPEDLQLGYGWLDQVHPDDRQRVSREWAATAARGEVFNIEFRIRRYDGAYRWFKTCAIPLKNKDGALVKWFGSNTDIDDLKRAEEALRESEERLSAELTALNILQKLSMRFVGEGDLGSLLDDIMGAAVEVAGTDKGTLQLLSPGSGQLDIVAQRGFAQDYIDFFSSVSHGTAAVCATAFGRGERVIVEDVEKSPIFVGTPALDVQRNAGVRAVQSTPLVNRRGKMIGMLSTHWGRPLRPDEHVLRYIDLLARQAADIIERKRAEDALRESRERYKLVVEGAQGAIWDWDVANKRVLFSEQWKALRGLTGEEVTGSEDEWSSRIHPDDAPRVFAAVEEHFEGKTPFFAEEYRIRCNDGSWKWISDRGMAQRDAAGRVMRMAGSEMDITERKLDEESLLAAKQQAELYLDLMGHDISNMHQIIMGQLELAQELFDVRGRLEGEDKDLINTSVRTLQRSAKLIDNIRNIQRLRSGEYKFENMDLGVVLEEVVRAYSGLPDRDIIIDYAPSHGFYLNANPLIKDIFNNLLDNAVKHCDDPVRIGIGVNRVEQNGGSFYQVVVEDNGRGVPDGKKEEIFNRLKRGDTRARGTGLGLYIVKTLVEGFNGTVRMEDRVPGDHGKGARFVIRLPIEGEGRRRCQMM